jgi:RNA polymerase sigma-70 factor, ECF subfamily
MQILELVDQDDQILVALYNQGNEKAFEILLNRHKSKMFRFIYLKVKNRALADDLFQETFFKIINTLKLGNYNEEGKFLPWAMRIAHNLVIDHFRKTSKVRLISESSSLTDEYNILHTLRADQDTVEIQLCKNELEIQMVELIEYLPEAQRNILKKRMYEDVSFKQIAEEEGISINTALGRMRYALINVRKLIEKHSLVVDI